MEGIGMIDPASLEASGYYQDYPTPSTTSQAESSPPPTEAPKKKRKAWGQPVPEIKQILPPRKRAKTAEEKEQRKNERILRNRRAADKSRQRQKAAVAELEQKTGRIVKENALLRDLLDKYQQRFGVPEGFQFAEPEDEEVDAPSPISLNNDATNPLDDSPYMTPAMTGSPHPTFSQTDSTTIVNQHSPTLTPSLVDASDNQAPKSEGLLDSALPSFTSSSVLTHYPAAVIYQAAEAALPSDFAQWPELSAPGNALPHDFSDVLNFNALADVPSFPDLGTEIGRELGGEHLLFNQQQLSPDSFFDFDAFNVDEKSGLPLETSEPASRLQPSHGAPITGSD
ncbi:uncharacterized protein HMPREF1541_00951 [Cyphellophora europaea CBS 101466]|uniref:BZIP domain-containing protein n=1 Tax=Cyphellophora europaea (strain CBS 101466) TaxID=1220924 RepID=W2SDI9_CYPE1|nr:uncharacterized protein HMPREF1541_00951 [Cyphellophora europaea CBS 101466]ETN46762.1 hypothetical protein HMPREF1541_00951 [Cyphellophora europaea CBS 101466]